MSQRILTIGDLCAVCGYSRHQMRGLLSESPIASANEVRARVASQYTSQDLLLVAILCRLEQHFGLRRETVASVAGHIAQEISAARVVTKQSKLLLTFEPSAAAYVEDSASFEDGLLVALAPVLKAIGDYLAPSYVLARDGSSADPGQVGRR